MVTEAQSVQECLQLSMKALMRAQLSTGTGRMSCLLNASRLALSQDKIIIIIIIIISTTMFMVLSS